MSSKRGLFALIFSFTLFAVVFLITVFLFADNPLRGICSKALSVTTWNVADVPRIFIPLTHRDYGLDDKVKQWILKQTDIGRNITGLQEDWYRHIYNGTRSKYSWALSYSSGFPDFYGGISILSQFYIGDHFFQRWNHAHGIDAEGEKGFAYLPIYIRVANSSGWTCQFPLHLYCLHAQSGNESHDREDRAIQLDQLSAFINSHSTGYSIIVEGDFNCYYNNQTDRNLLTSFMNKHNLTMANNTGQYTNTSGNLIDYILFRTGDYRESLQLVNCNVKYDAQGSDHYPVKANFNFSVNYDAYPDLVVTDILQFQYSANSEEGWSTVMVKNNGPAASDKTSQVHMTITGVKNVYGLGYLPKLNSGQSAAVEVDMPGLVLDPSIRSVNISATADRPSIIKENNELNNNLIKLVNVLRY